MKALVFSDLHLHSHKGSIDRLQDCLQTLNWVFETAEAKGAKYIFFLGDLFHEQGKIDVLTYLRTFEVFMQHMLDDAKDIDVYLLVGNHDMYHKQRWDVNSVKPLTAIPRVHLIDKPCTVEIGGRTIDWLPHVDNPIKFLDSLTGKSLLLGHLAVDGATLNTFYGVKSDVIVEYDNDMSRVSANIFQDWQLVLLGHYHGQQRLCNKKLEYVGSPLQLSFGEAFQTKHIVLLDLDTLSCEYIQNDFSPKHYIITPDDVENGVYDLNGNFVRVIIDNLGAKELVDLKQKIKCDYQVSSLDFKSQDKRADDDQQEIQNAKDILQEGEVLKVWIKEMEQTKQIPVDNLDLGRLLDVGEQICAQQGRSNA
jgi:DNA repair exonuclease SbcCD nuclease subunit